VLQELEVLDTIQFREERDLVALSQVVVFAAVVVGKKTSAGKLAPLPRYGRTSLINYELLGLAKDIER
jgi:hypothetical protein